MRCGTVRKKLSAYMDKRLDKDLTARMDEHLDGCKGCRTELGLLLKMKEALAILGPVQPDPELARKVADVALSKARLKTSARPSLLDQLFSFRRSAAVTAAAAAALATVLALQVWLKKDGPPHFKTQNASEPVAGLISMKGAGLDQFEMAASVLAEEED